MQINIIDPSSTEFNRGSFCYAPYLCYNGLSDTHEVLLLETFLPENLDNIPDADIQLVCLWSYPQIECATMLAQMLPFMFNKDNVYFVGYSPLIEELGFRHISKFLGIDPLKDDFFLLRAMRNYPKNYMHFEQLLLSDCDMHIKDLQKDKKVYPLFTSYGCPHGCAFCPSSKNCGKRRIELSVEETCDMLDECIAQGINYIHFTDEDFFFNTDRAYAILDYLRNKDMHLIALSSAEAATDFIAIHGTVILEQAGLEVMEIGFESGDVSVSQHMGVGKSLSDCSQLAEIQDELPFRIFWLVLTFFPGETIRSLNETGRFLRTYGFEQDQVMGRLRTNGTKGGLGQFFQPYDGVAIFKTLAEKGMFLTDRPVRLTPSYIPNSFLDSVITDTCVDNLASAFPYLKLYNVSIPKVGLKIGMSVRDYIAGKPVWERTKIVIAMAILARMDVIR